MGGPEGAVKDLRRVDRVGLGIPEESLKDALVTFQLLLRS